MTVEQFQLIKSARGEDGNIYIRDTGLEAQYPIAEIVEIPPAIKITASHSQVAEELPATFETTTELPVYYTVPPEAPDLNPVSSNGDSTPRAHRAISGKGKIIRTSLIIAEALSVASCITAQNTAPTADFQQQTQAANASAAEATAQALGQEAVAAAIQDTLKGFTFEEAQASLNPWLNVAIVTKNGTPAVIGNRPEIVTVTDNDPNTIDPPRPMSAVVNGIVDAVSIWGVAFTNTTNPDLPVVPMLLRHNDFDNTSQSFALLKEAENYYRILEVVNGQAVATNRLLVLSTVGAGVQMRIAEPGKPDIFLVEEIDTYDGLPQPFPGEPVAPQDVIQQFANFESNPEQINIEEEIDLDIGSSPEASHKLPDGTLVHGALIKGGIYVQKALEISNPPITGFNLPEISIAEYQTKHVIYETFAHYHPEVTFSDYMQRIANIQEAVSKGISIDFTQIAIPVKLNDKDDGIPYKNPDGSLNEKAQIDAWLIPWYSGPLPENINNDGRKVYSFEEMNVYIVKNNKTDSTTTINKDGDMGLGVHINGNVFEIHVSAVYGSVGKPANSRNTAIQLARVSWFLINNTGGEIDKRKPPYNSDSYDFLMNSGFAVIPSRP